MALRNIGVVHNTVSLIKQLSGHQYRAIRDAMFAIHGML